MNLMSPTLRNYNYLFSLLPGIFVVTGNYLGGWWVISNFIFSLFVLPLLEWFFPENLSNESDERPFIPDMVLILHVVMQILSLTALFLSIQAGRIVGWQYFWAAVSTGIHSGSSSIVIAHEMIHRKERLWQWLGKFLLFTCGNFYFYIEHLKVHHKWVGTEKDPATAKYGESLYRFYVRTTVGQIRDAWKVEGERLQKENKNKIDTGNYVLASLLLLFLLLCLIYSVMGAAGLFIFLLQGFTANFLLEYTNYIEHYGLSRQENERVNEMISWQSDKIISRFILIDLSRHSDHHYYASKPFHTLSTYKNSPVLPGGYASAIYLALLPPLWFKIVHRRLEEFRISNSRN